jgi:hypothetical protein
MTANSHGLITLISVSALGVVAIPFGNPKFTGEAIIVELSFITLSVLVSSHSFNDNFFKTSQCINSNNWWIHPPRNLNLY